MKFTSIAFLALSLCLPLWGADKDKPLTPREVMQLFIGTWDSEMTIIPEGDPTKAKTSQMIRTRKWSRKKTFVVEQANPDEGIWVLTYDPKKKNYRSVFITPEITDNIYGNWDDSKKIMTWHGREDNGNILNGHHRVINKDHHEWELSLFNGDKLLVKLTGKHKRRLKTKQ